MDGIISRKAAANKSFERGPFQLLVNASALSGRAFWRDGEVRQGSPGAFDKAV